MSKNLKRIICTLLAAASLCASCASASPLPTPKPSPQIDPDAGVRVTPTPTPTPRPVRIPGWGGISFDARAEELYIDLYNPEENADMYYLTYTLYIVHEVVNEETQETETEYEEVFSTGLIPPGLAVNSVTLDHKIEPGEYSAYMYVQPYFMSTNMAASAAGFELVLTVYEAEETVQPQ